MMMMIWFDDDITYQIITKQTRSVEGPQPSEQGSKSAYHARVARPCDPVGNNSANTG